MGSQAADSASPIPLTCVLRVFPSGIFVWLTALLLIDPTGTQAQDSPSTVSAPLFASQEPLAFTLEADFGQLKKDRSQDSEEREGRLVVPGPGGEDVTIPILVKTRGNFRLRKEKCAFPPLRLDLPEVGMEGTPLDGQDKLKVVTYCMDNDNYEQNVLEEYLIYRIYNLFTDISFRVRLAEITYVDSKSGGDVVTRKGFLLEDEDAMAARLDGGMLTDQVQACEPWEYQQEAAGQMYLFQYLIGNEDWSHTHFHNIELIRIGWEYFPVPYDFDFSGLVDAPYAIPNPELDMKTVRERRYFGSCSDQIDYQALFANFNRQREAILDLLGSEGLLTERNVRSAHRYIEEFYGVINDQRQAEKLILRACVR